MRSPLILALASVAAALPPAERQDSAGQQFKNIQLFKEIPATQLLPMMHFMRTSLGVRCDYCHVAQNDKYALDDKEPKRIARQMIQLVRAINETHFDGKTVVTCNTCHRGQTKPVGVPAVSQGVFTNTIRATDRADALPDAQAIIARYLRALGGRAAVERVATRILEGSLLKMRVVHPGTSDAYALARGDRVGLTVYEKGSQKYAAVAQTPQGTIKQVWTGDSGWVQSPAGQRELTLEEAKRVQQQLARDDPRVLIGAALHPKTLRKELVGQREAFVVAAELPDSRTEELWFDVKTFLLLRTIVYTPIALGLDPEQTDYEDYRKVGALLVPFSTKVSYLDDSHLGFTRRFNRIRLNEKIDDSIFERDFPRGK